MLFVFGEVYVIMHGGSGVSEEDYQEVIRRGVRKVNYYTYMANAIRENVKSAITVFSKILQK